MNKIIHNTAAGLSIPTYSKPTMNGAPHWAQSLQREQERSVSNIVVRDAPEEIAQMTEEQLQKAFDEVEDVEPAGAFMHGGTIHRAAAGRKVHNDDGEDPITCMPLPPLEQCIDVARAPLDINKPVWRYDVRTIYHIMQGVPNTVSHSGRCATWMTPMQTSTIDIANKDTMMALQGAWKAAQAEDTELPKTSIHEAWKAKVREREEDNCKLSLRQAVFMRPLNGVNNNPDLETLLDDVARAVRAESAIAPFCTQNTLHTALRRLGLYVVFYAKIDLFYTIRLIQDTLVMLDTMDKDLNWTLRRVAVRALENIVYELLMYTDYRLLHDTHAMMSTVLSVRRGCAFAQDLLRVNIEPVLTTHRDGR